MAVGCIMFKSIKTNRCACLFKTIANSHLDIAAEDCKKVKKEKGNNKQEGQVQNQTFHQSWEDAKYICG